MCKEYREHCRCGNWKTVHIELCPRGHELRRLGRPFFHHLPEIILNPTMRRCPQCQNIPTGPATTTRAQAGPPPTSRRLWDGQPSAQPSTQGNPISGQRNTPPSPLQAPRILANPYRYFEGLGPENERAASPVTAHRTPMFDGQDRAQFARSLAQLSSTVSVLSWIAKSVPQAQLKAQPESQTHTQAQPQPQPKPQPQMQLPSELSASSIADLPAAFAKLKVRGSTEWAEHMNSTPAASTIPPPELHPAVPAPKEPSPAAATPIIETVPPQEPLLAALSPQEPSPATPVPIIETVAHLVPEVAIEDVDDDGEYLTASSTAASDSGESCESSCILEKGVEGKEVNEAEWELVRSQDMPPAGKLSGGRKGDGLRDWEVIHVL
ncbi:hypothetical protein BU16DRAFT_77571 [Lophium mytilinum]|uniref:Uncharacterized protein n=1 Tax=Lophium mytilinum TaxID=390894 RepID=A0A6A6QR67_9PEZI|nr:hypothetical protein BU16DRAFT_77571 [Lophium mytilinum]